MAGDHHTYSSGRSLPGQSAITLALSASGSVFAPSSSFIDTGPWAARRVIRSASSAASAAHGIGACLSFQTVAPVCGKR